MATNKLTFSEIFYHKSSALRLELNTYKDRVRFKIEVIPALKDAQGNIILSPSGKSTFDYNNSFSMFFSSSELLRIKKCVENIINPAKKTGELPGEVPANGYIIEHYFEKKKSAFTLKRMENNYKPKFHSPFEYKYAVALSIYSSAKGDKGASSGIVLAEDESYWIMNLMPLLALESIKETGRVGNESRSTQGTKTGNSEGPSGTTGTSAPTGTPVSQASAPSQDQGDLDHWEEDIPF